MLLARDSLQALEWLRMILSLRVPLDPSLALPGSSHPDFLVVVDPSLGHCETGFLGDEIHDRHAVVGRYAHDLGRGTQHLWASYFVGRDVL